MYYISSMNTTAHSDSNNPAVTIIAQYAQVPDDIDTLHEICTDAAMFVHDTYELGVNQCRKVVVIANDTVAYVEEEDTQESTENALMTVMKTLLAFDIDFTVELQLVTF